MTKIQRCPWVGSIHGSGRVGSGRVGSITVSTKFSERGSDPVFANIYFFPVILLITAGRSGFGSKYSIFNDG